MSHTLAMRARRIPLFVYLLVVLALVLLLSLSLLLSSGARAGAGGSDPNGVTIGPTINPDGLACGSMINPDGGCLSHGSHLLATGPTIDNNG